MSDTSNISGTMMKLRLLARDTIAKDLTTNFACSNYQTINKSGEIFSTTSDQYQVTINKTLSYENISLEAISIFPNPANNEVNIKTGVNIKDVILSNSKGEQYKIQLNNSSFSTSNLLNGFYIIRIRDINGNFVNKKLIIQHN